MIRFTRHSRRRMERREISEQEVKEVLASPETTYDAADDPTRTVVLGRTVEGRRLKVVTPKADPGLVITVADRDQEG